MTIPVLMVLLFAVWTILLLVLTVGVYRWGSVFAGKAQLIDFRADDVKGSDFYKRAMRAHANCIENLPIFIAVVFAAHVTNSVSAAVVTMSIIVLAARILQSLVHVIFVQTNTITFVRFCLFFSQILCFFGIAFVVLSETFTKTV
ncbi:MAPEG family protein [Aestuariicella hydrocarbonica]|uniref:MAPEG family protein n=2 Tax=Pseudomaricurvus hydrocarbonicus TaxID=1470433 RepID=A0A9E5JSF5_9GAMM|nr:MAPEG family protein [Aestuariicella hydrocarbonica]